MYSFIHVFIYNSITNCYWQNFAKSLAKAFRKKPPMLPLILDFCFDLIDTVMVCEQNFKSTTLPFSNIRGFRNTVMISYIFS